MLNALIVIYNKYCCNSISFNYIKKYKSRLNIIIFDNSESDYGNRKYCKENKIKYYTLNKNIGLSRAYNYVLEKIRINNNDYLLILDDDTILNDEYIDEVLRKVHESKFDLLLPVVKSNERIISPSKIIFGCRVKQIKTLDEINDNNITGINSGMVIRTSVYNLIKYNDKMFLDYVDHEFMRKVRAKKLKINVLESVIYQNFFMDEKSNIKTAMKRFNIYKKDFKKYCDICGNNLFYRISILKLKVNNLIKYKRFF